MVDLKVRHLVIDKRYNKIAYRWIPSPSLKKLGFKTTTLSSNKAKAIAQAEELNEMADKARDGEVTNFSEAEGYVEWLIRQYKHSQEYKDLADKTRYEYDRNLKRIHDWAYDKHASTITRRAALALHNAIRYEDEKKDKLRTANAVITTLRLLLSYASNIGVIKTNPLYNLRLKHNAARNQIWSKEETDHFCKHATEQGWASIAAAVRIAEYFGLDLADILRIPRSAYNGQQLDPNFRSKTNRKLPCVLVLEDPKEAIDALPLESPILLINEATKKPWLRDTFAHKFLELKRECTEQIRQELLFRDLRRTAVVNLLEAECSEIEATSISGHKIDSIKGILEVYSPRTQKMADNAMLKLQKSLTKKSNYRKINKD